MRQFQRYCAAHENFRVHPVPSGPKFHRTWLPSFMPRRRMSMSWISCALNGTSCPVPSAGRVGGTVGCGLGHATGRFLAISYPIIHTGVRAAIFLAVPGGNRQKKQGENAQSLSDMGISKKDESPSEERHCRLQRCGLIEQRFGYSWDAWVIHPLAVVATAIEVTRDRFFQVREHLQLHFL